MSENPVPPRIPPRRPPAMPMPPAAAPKVSPVSKTPAPPSPTAPVATASVETPPPQETGEPIVAKGAGEYRVRRYIMTLLLIAGGAWFGYDGWKGWPGENRQIDSLNHQLEDARKAGNSSLVDSINSNPLVHKTPHSPLDIRWQKNLAVILPIGGILFLFWTLFNSRGEYRLENGILSIPGHPKLRLSEITGIDKSKWDRKGIGYVFYTPANGKSGKLRLDDFVYKQEPTDEIFKRIEQSLKRA